MAKKSILILNGPGLADLHDVGEHSYGGLSLADIESQCATLCGCLNINLDFQQTDEEQQMFRWIDNGAYDGLIINPVGYSRAASVNFELFRHAIRLIAHLKKPVIEIHISNIFLPGAEVTKPLQVPEADIGFISGLGVNSYLLAIKAINKRLNR